MAAVLKFHKLSAKDHLQKVLISRDTRKRVSRLDDMAQLGKCLVLCGPCEAKFNRRRFGYEQRRDIPVVCGTCDGCREWSGCATFLRKRE